MARITYATVDDLPEEYRELLVSYFQGEAVNAYRAFGVNPEVLRGVRALMSVLWSDTGLSPRERELAILVVAREAEAEYEWHSHVKIAQGIDVPHDRVLSREEVLAVSRREYVAFDEPERTLIDYVLGVIGWSVDDDLHDRLTAAYDESTVVGTGVLVGAYLMAARVFDAVDIDTDGEFHGWELENLDDG